MGRKTKSSCRLGMRQCLSGRVLQPVHDFVRHHAWHRACPHINASKLNGVNQREVLSRIQLITGPNLVNKLIAQTAQGKTRPWWWLPYLVYDQTQMPFGGYLVEDREDASVQ